VHGAAHLRSVKRQMPGQYRHRHPTGRFRSVMRPQPTPKAPAQLIASTPYDASWAKITICGEGQAGRQVAVDIGIGSSGNEVVIINNLGMGSYAQIR
jgi:hypothetical protein